MASKKAREYIEKEIKKYRKAGYPQNQAIAIAYSRARKKGFRI